MVSLAVTYFRTGNPHYHRRCVVSRPCSGWEGVGPTRYGRQAIQGSSLMQPRVGRPRQATTDSEEVKGGGIAAALIDPGAQGYRIKPHGQLVPVSSSDCSPSTSGLSTSWSRTTLEGDHLTARVVVERVFTRTKVVSGKSHLGACFALRCFQRLSLPHLATRRYDWRHNRYTSGASTPVLSY